MNREAKTESMPLRFTKREAELLQAAAANAQMMLRDWMRTELLAAADRLPGNIGQLELFLLTEGVSQHMLLQASSRMILSALGVPVAHFDAMLLDICRQKRHEARKLLAKYEGNKDDGDESISAAGLQAVSS